MSSHTSQSSVLLTRDGGLVRQAFIKRKQDATPSGVFKLQPRSNDPAIWNRAGDLCEQLGLDPDVLVAVVFAGSKGTSAARYVTLMPNALSGPFAIRCLADFYKVKHDASDPGMLKKLKDAIVGMSKIDFATAIDPTEPMPNSPEQGEYYKFWSALRELNADMYRASFTMDPQFHLKLFTLENGFHTLAAKSILAANVPKLRSVLWPAYADALLNDLPQWRLLQRLKKEDKRIQLFVGWVGMFRRDLHGRK